MQSKKTEGPEINLLHSIIDEELKEEENKELKELIKRKAENLYPLLSLLTTYELDDDEIKKKIKSLIEEEQ